MYIVLNSFEVEKILKHELMFVYLTIPDDGSNMSPNVHKISKVTYSYCINAIWTLTMLLDQV